MRTSSPACERLLLSQWQTSSQAGGWSLAPLALGARNIISLPDRLVGWVTGAVQQLFIWCLVRVREALCELELPYRRVACGEGSKRRAELQKAAGSTQVPLHDCMTGAVGCACSGMQREPSCFV